MQKFTEDQIEITSHYVNDVMGGYNGRFPDWWKLHSAEYQHSEKEEAKEPHICKYCGAKTK